MHSATILIPARSRQQAMDWSLVLVSQGIETAISSPTETEGWGLLVNQEDQDRALAILQQYHLENQSWPWRQEMFRPGLLFDWGCLAWVFLIIVFYWLQTQYDIRSFGRVDGSALAAGQWWRLFTAVWLHGDLGHLAANASIGLILLGLVMGCYGTGMGLLAAYVAGALGNLFACLVGPFPHLSLGASGLVMACVGLLAAQSIPMWRKDPRSAKVVIGALLGGVMLFALLGLSPETDVLAHLGGFLAGLVIGIPLSFDSRLPLRASVNLAAGLVFVVLVVIPWWLALTHAPARITVNNV